MGQKRKPFQERIKDGASEGNIMEIHSVNELTELLQQTAEDGTMLSVMAEVNGNE